MVRLNDIQTAATVIAEKKGNGVQEASLLVGHEMAIAMYLQDAYSLEANRPGQVIPDVFARVMAYSGEFLDDLGFLSFIHFTPLGGRGAVYNSYGEVTHLVEVKPDGEDDVIDLEKSPVHIGMWMPGAEPKEYKTITAGPYPFEKARALMKPLVEQAHRQYLIAHGVNPDAPEEPSDFVDPEGIWLNDQK